MSLSPPPLPAASLRRSCRLFWCHPCRHPVHILFSSSANSDILCPRCSGQFLHELNLPLPLPPPPSPPQQFLQDFPFPQWSPPHDPLPPPPPPPHLYFTGPNLNGLIDDLTQNDRPGPPPAPASSIDALPTVSITAEHLRDGSQCPVCKEEFAVGEEATEMPCRHAYHSDCIVPWLHLHNSCPVCRFELPGAEPAGRDQSRNRGGGGGYRRQLRPDMWSPFAILLWPFRASSWHPAGWEQYHRFAGNQREEGGSGLISHLAAYFSLLVCLVYFLRIAHAGRRTVPGIRSLLEEALCAWMKIQHLEEVPHLEEDSRAWKEISSGRRFMPRRRSACWKKFCVLEEVLCMKEI